MDIDRLETWLKVLNMAAAPLAVAITGFFVLSWRRRRRSTMSPRRFIVLSIAALAAIIGALFLASGRNPPRDSGGAPLLPGLAAELDTVTAVVLRKGAPAPAVSLRKLAAGWAVAERGDYPADAAKVRTLLISLGDAAVIEEKTANPANYPAIGVDDPAAEHPARASRSRARDGVHSVIIGKPSATGCSRGARARRRASWCVPPSTWRRNRVIGSMHTSSMSPPRAWRASR